MVQAATEKNLFLSLFTFLSPRMHGGTEREVIFAVSVAKICTAGVQRSHYE
jgi:hypothetical protein